MTERALHALPSHWRVSTIHYYRPCLGCGHQWGSGISYDVRPAELADAERTEWCDHCQPVLVFPPVGLVAELWEPAPRLAP